MDNQYSKNDQNLKKSFSEELDKAKILVEALPYIKKFRGKRIVVKIGGKVIADPKYQKSVIKDIVLLYLVGMIPIVVHGGGKQIDDVLQKLGKKSDFSKGIRITDDETMDVVQMVLVGLINKNLVSLISIEGGNAIGMSGHDGRLISVIPLHHKDVDLGRVGKIEKINISLLERICTGMFNMIPVIAPVGIDAEGKSFNINADAVATEIASALCAEKLIFVSDIEGVFIRKGSKKEMIRTLHLDEIARLEKEKQITGGMFVKLQSARKALEEGVRTVHIVSGIKPHSLLMEIFTDHGVGTDIVS